MRIKKKLKNFLKNFRKTIDVNYTDFAQVVGYNYRNREKPYYLIQHIIVIVRVDTQTYYIKLDKGFTSDGCTIPRFLWNIFGCPHTPKYLPASLIHDYVLNNPETVIHNRNLSSRIFKQVLLNEGVNKIKAETMYLTVDIVQWVKNFKTRKWR